MERLINAITDENMPEYATNLVPEKEICRKFEQYEEMFAMSGRDVYLYKAEVLQEILGISNDDAAKVHEYYLAKYGK